MIFTNSIGRRAFDNNQIGLYPNILVWFKGYGDCLNAMQRWINKATLDQGQWRAICNLMEKWLYFEMFAENVYRREVTFRHIQFNMARTPEFSCFINKISWWICNLMLAAFKWKWYIRFIIVGISTHPLYTFYLQYDDEFNVHEMYFKMRGESFEENPCAG